jgi:hypothetical protein
MFLFNVQLLLDIVCCHSSHLLAMMSVPRYPKSDLSMITYLNPLDISNTPNIVVHQYNEVHATVILFESEEAN